VDKPGWTVGKPKTFKTLTTRMLDSRDITRQHGLGETRKWATHQEIQIKEDA